MGMPVRFLRALALGAVLVSGTLLSAAGLGIATSRPALAQNANSIVVEGSRRVEPATVRSYFHPGPGGRLGPAEIDEGLKSLYATGLFADVRLSNVGGRLIVTVVENPVINEVAFEGNKKAKDDQLKAEVQSKARGTLQKATVQADVQRIIEVYHRTGYYDIDVVPKTIELPNNRVNLVFEIKEGPKTGVIDIRYVGARTYGASRLNQVIKTSVTNWLSFLQTSNIYDPDRIEADRDLLRRFYLQHGFADVRIVSAVGEYDPARKGFVITFTIDEGPQYHVGTVDVVSNVRALNPDLLRNRLKVSPGAVYNADLVEKSVEAMTIEAARSGYAFATVRPRGERHPESRSINLAFVVEEGTRAYIERINIHGNTRTRDYVIRREFDIGEGDAYNRALIDRAERRLKNLNFFKNVKITNEPGSAPDRVIVNVELEEQPTGEFSIAGGYSTADGALVEVSIADRNLLGRGQFAKAAITYGQRTRGFDLSFVEPYLFGYRMAGGVDFFARQNLASNFVSYDTTTVGTNLRLGFALTEEIAFQPRYSFYRQEIKLPDQYNCYPAASLDGTIPAAQTPSGSCIQPASLPVRVELANGPVNVSLVGYTLSYNTLDNVRAPTSGLYAELRQDFAGVGGDVNFTRTQAEARTYYEVLPDIVSVLKLQGGAIEPWGGKTLRMLDHFQMGPNLVRGFAPAGIGPRDLTTGTTNDALGGSLFWGASVEAQTPLYFLPKEIGIKVAAFADAGSVWDYRGITVAPNGLPNTDLRFAPPQSVAVGLDGASMIRSSVGVGLLWIRPSDRCASISLIRSRSTARRRRRMA